MLLEQLGIFGWKEQDENLALASLLTGDPLLLIGNHGCAKTHIANKMAESLGRSFIVYDASKAMFEDILGYPNVEKLKHGIVEYIPSPVTIWDKEFIVFDEINRALPELQSKLLECIRSRRISGFPTQVKWVWAAMNPASYSATNALDEALIGRFAFFLYPPDVLQMTEEDRIRVTTHINGDDAPSLSVWLPETNGKTVSPETVQQTGKEIIAILQKAAMYFHQLQCSLNTLSEFLAKFANLLLRESKGEIVLDGRRLGFLYRSLLANRAVELAKAEILHTPVESFVTSARYAVQSGIPVGLNDSGANRDQAIHAMDICFDLLSRYFEKGTEIETVNRIYELFTTRDLLRKAEILLTEKVGEFAASKAWHDLMNSGGDITLLAYVALQVETHRPGTLPAELLESLSRTIDSKKLCTASLPNLRGEAIEWIEEIEVILNQPSDIGRLAAYYRIHDLIVKDHFTPQDLEDIRQQILVDTATFQQLIHESPSK